MFRRNTSNKQTNKTKEQERQLERNFALSLWLSIASTNLLCLTCSSLQQLDISGWTKHLSCVSMCRDLN